MIDADAIRQRIAQREIAARLRRREAANAVPSLAIEADWRTWLPAVGPRTFTGSFAPFHAEFWNWYWRITQKRRAGEPLTDEETVFLAIWARGFAKSSSVEWAAIAEGALVGSGFVLYVSGTQALAEGHVQAIRERIESEDVARYYPHLANPQVGRHGNQYGWRQDFLRTAGGWSIRPLGLDVGVRGGRVGDVRPSLIILDDVDDHTDSPAVVQKKLDTIARGIVPAGTRGTVILGAQNLIHRESVFARIVERRTGILSQRIVSGPYPAFADLEIGTEETADGPRHVIAAGTPTWPDMDLAACQKFLDDSGREAFLAEYQHDFSARAQGTVFPEWDELFHVITWSEFVRVFGRIACGCAHPHPAEGRCPNPRIPETWNLGRGLDWGTTSGHPCVTVWAARPAERDAHNDCVFVYRELVRPRFPGQPGDAPDLVNPRRIALEIVAAEQRWRETDRMTMSVMSHEASATQNTFLDPDEPEFNRLRFVKHKAVRNQAGIPQIQNALHVDATRPHPFRRNPETGEALMGRPRLYVIVADGQGEVTRGTAGRWTARGASDERGMSRLRWEMPRYHYPQTAAGLEREKPLKADDDAIDALKHIAGPFFPRRAPLTRDERIEAALPEGWRREAVTLANWDQRIVDRELRIKEIEREWAEGRRSEIAHGEDSWGANDLEAI